MIDWDKQLLAKLKSLKIISDVYTRFKDDIESLEKGSMLVENKIVVDKNKKSSR